MVKLLSCLLAAAAISSVCLPTTTNGATDDETNNTGNELINYCNDKNYQSSNIYWDFCVGYVAGVSDSMQSVSGIVKTAEHSNTSDKSLINAFKIIYQLCSPINVTRQQLALVVSKYLHDHPEQLNYSSYFLAVDAFQEAWPCPKTGK